MSPDITVIRVVQDQRFRPGVAKITELIRVDFMVGEHGPFSETFLKSEYNAATRDAKLETFAREVR